MIKTADVLMIGCGNMGAALAAGYCQAQPGKRVIAVDPNIERARAMTNGLKAIELVPSIDVIKDVQPSALLLAVKPQIMPSILPALAETRAAKGLVISIAAGISVDALKQALPEASLVRVMPNTPASVGEGVAVLYGDLNVTLEQRKFCEDFFFAVGSAHWVSNEKQIDSATAISGSGPAYFCAIIEILTKAGTAIGLTSEFAAALAINTMAGSAAMLRKTGQPPAELKAAVRSPAGTTDAALRIFEHDDALESVITRAVIAAHDRAVELGHAPR